MRISEAISQLKSLKAHCESMAKEPDSEIWKSDIKALDAGVFALVLIEGQGYETIGG
jgi:hypothetical protein